MASVRGWRPATSVRGPEVASADDIRALNGVFSDAFSERYRRDGMVGVRVPNLNPQIWRYAIEDAAQGALLWRDARGEIAAFNMVHQSGIEGWMGPLAVRTDQQGSGLGKDVVTHGIRWLQRSGARVIGLETMPRTMDNIGFYSVLGFVPGRLTITLSLDAVGDERPPELLGRLAAADREEMLLAVGALTTQLLPGYDFTREIVLTLDLALGDAVLLREGGALVGVALCHTAPLVESRVRDELRVLKLVLARDDLLDPMVRALRDFAKRSGTRRVAIRVQGECGGMYQRLVAMGAHVRWTDLRMSLAGYPEVAPARGVVLSNWEI